MDRQIAAGLNEVRKAAPSFGHFDQFKQTEIRKDGSNTGLGAVLFELQDYTGRVIAYASRTLSKAEGNY